MRRRTAIEAVQRGTQSLGANWQLVLAHLVQTVVVSILAVAGALPYVLVVGVGTLQSLFESTRDGAEDPLLLVDRMLSGLTESAGALLLATFVALCVWTVALVVYAWVQAGVFGVLAVGDGRAATSGPRRIDFAAFDMARFRASADRGLWTFFWLVNLFMLIVSVVLLLLLILVVLAGGLFANNKVGTAISLGCSGALVAIVLSVASALWWQLAMAAAASGREGLWEATVTGWRILVGRAGAVSVLALLAFVVGMTVALALTPVSLVVELALGDSIVAYVGSQIVLTIVQSVFSAVISVGLAAVFVALVRGEIDGGEALVA